MLKALALALGARGAVPAPTGTVAIIDPSPVYEGVETTVTVTVTGDVVRVVLDVVDGAEIWDDSSAPFTGAWTPGGTSVVTLRARGYAEDDTLLDTDTIEVTPGTYVDALVAAGVIEAWFPDASTCVLGSRLLATRPQDDDDTTITIDNTTSLDDIVLQVTTQGGLNVGKFRWSIDGGATWGGSDVTIAATVAITGHTITFQNTTYYTSYSYKSVIESATGLVLGTVLTKPGTGLQGVKNSLQTSKTGWAGTTQAWYADAAFPIIAVPSLEGGATLAGTFSGVSVPVLLLSFFDPAGTSGQTSPAEPLTLCNTAGSDRHIVQTTPYGTGANLYGGRSDAGGANYVAVLGAGTAVRQCLGSECDGTHQRLWRDGVQLGEEDADSRDRTFNNVMIGGQHLSGNTRGYRCGCYFGPQLICHHDADLDRIIELVALRGYSLA